MSKEVIFFGWNRSVPGREQMSAQHFQEMSAYVSGLQASGEIDSFEVVLLGSHGGDMNGFFLIRGSNEQLNVLQASEGYIEHATRAGHHLEGFGAIRGVTGEGVMEWMARWAKFIPG